MVEYASNRKARKCRVCQEGIVRKHLLAKRCYYNMICTACDGIGYFDIDPTLGCTQLPGDPVYQAVLAARVRAGLPLWHDDDKRVPEILLCETCHECQAMNGDTICVECFQRGLCSRSAKETAIN